MVNRYVPPRKLIQYALLHTVVLLTSTNMDGSMESQRIPLLSFIFQHQNGETRDSISAIRLLLESRANPNITSSVCEHLFA